MTNADDKENLPNTNQTVGVTKTELASELGAVQDQLRAMNSVFQENMQSLAQAMKPPTKAQATFNDDVIYDAKKLETAVSTQASKIAQDLIRSERELNTTVYNMAQDYPEIQSDPAIQKAVREAQATLPAHMRDTALGLETAILKTVTKAGLIPKSRRQVVDDDISVGSGRGASGEGSRGQSRSGSKQKVSDDSLAFAEALGLPIDDPKYIERLEKASSRKNYSRYE